MCNKTRVAAIFASAVILVNLVLPSMSWAGTVTYFYNQSDSAAAISVTIKGKTTVTVKPVAPGHISAAITLPPGHPDPMTASPAAQKMIKEIGLPPTALLDFTLHAPGGSTKLGLPLHTEVLRAGQTRVLIYFMRVKSPNVAPDPLDMPVISIRDQVYGLALKGRALTAIVDETKSESFQSADNAHFNVWFRKGGNVLNEATGIGVAFVSPDQLPPDHYDLLAATATPYGLTAISTIKPIGAITAANLIPGKISIYLIRTPGKLEHVTTLSPQ